MSNDKTLDRKSRTLKILEQYLREDLICEVSFNKLKDLDFKILGKDSFGYINVKYYIKVDGYTYSRTTRLHTLITSCPKNKVVDHINGIPYDNRYSNLRIVTDKDNSRNKTLSKKSKSMHRHIAVYKHSYRVVVFGKHVGYYKELSEALTARDSYYLSIGYRSVRL